jgi:hypothetical protein
VECVLPAISSTLTALIVWPVITPNVKRVPPRESVLSVRTDLPFTTKLIVSHAIRLTVLLAISPTHVNPVNQASV